MVKLFVGNLADNVDSNRLKNLFLEHVKVQECDVLKNFAFVHVANEDDADVAIEKFQKYKLEGKELHVERSTSNLRRQPGMSDKCFTCGAEDHKTSQCHKNPNRKRNISHQQLEPLVKKPKPLIFSQPFVEDYRIQQPTSTTQSMQPTYWGNKIGGGNDVDPELPCPQNPELHRLYEQYMDARTRYFFYREQLTKELRFQPQSTLASLTNFGPSSQGMLTGPTATRNGTNAPVADNSIIRVDLTNFVRSNGKSAPIITSRSLIPEHHQAQPHANPSHLQQNIYQHLSPMPPSIHPPPNHYSSISYSTTNFPPTAPNPNPAMPPLIKSEPIAPTGGAHYAYPPTIAPASQHPLPAYQTTYTGAASHYNTMSAPRQLIMPTVAPPPKKQPTPLAAVQPFAAYK